jgi:hypothetical protein
MSSLTADTTDDAGGEVLLLRAVILSVTDLAAVLASLVLVVTKCTVEGGELTELVALEFVLAFRNGGSLNVVSMEFEKVKSGELTYSLNDVVDELLGLVDLLLGIGHDQAVQILFLVAGVSCVRSSFTLLHGAFATNRDLRTGFGLHFLECVSTGANEKTNC